MGARVSADLNSPPGELSKPINAEQAEGGRTDRLVPCVAAADLATDSERGGRNPTVFEHRRGDVEQIFVAIVEGQQHGPPRQPAAAFEPPQCLLCADEVEANTLQQIELA